MSVPLVETAAAKVNLTLRIFRRRADGYHEISSLVVFADCGDRLSLTPGGELTLTVGGPRAAQAGAAADNLVLKAARALAVRPIQPARLCRLGRRRLRAKLSSVMK
ncbi:MAG: hypothetical protein WBF24_00790, partial [Xanthobacteraceae bacterium]